MVGFIIFQRLSPEHTKEKVEQIQAWFKTNPRRRVCCVDMDGIRFKVKRKTVKQDTIEAIGTTYED